MELAFSFWGLLLFAFFLKDTHRPTVTPLLCFKHGTQPLADCSLSYFSFRKKPAQKLRRQGTAVLKQLDGKVLGNHLACFSSVLGVSSCLSIKLTLQIKRTSQSEGYSSAWAFLGSNIQFTAPSPLGTV